jgi:hypothetical protein
MSGRGAIIRKALEFLRQVRKRSHGHAPHVPSTTRPHFKPRQTGPARYTNLKGMDSRFAHEADAMHPQNPFRPKAVRRLSDAEREHHRVYVDDNGLMRSAKDDSLFDTRGSSTHWGGTSGDKAIFVMDEHGNIYASKYQAVGDFHHSTLANGGPVASAGEIKVTNGKVDFLTSQSGHYRPTADVMHQAVDEFGRHNVPNVPVFDWDGSKLF